MRITHACVKLIALAVLLMFCARTVATVPLPFRQHKGDSRSLGAGDTYNEFVRELSRILASRSRFMSDHDESFLPSVSIATAKRNVDLINSLLSLPQDFNDAGR